MPHGILKFLPEESFEKPPGEPTQEERMEREYDRMEPPEKQSTWDWLRIHEAKRRGSTFILEAKRPEFSVSLISSPENPREGRYEIHSRPRAIAACRQFATGENLTRVTRTIHWHNANGTLQTFNPLPANINYQCVHAQIIKWFGRIARHDREASSH